MSGLMKVAKRSKKKSRASKRKWRYAKKRALGREKPMVSLGMGFPEKVQMNLKYHDLINFSTAAGATSNYQFVANGLYDPNYTGGGHQPRYFDQIMGLYNHYQVTGSKIRVTFSPRWDDDTTGNVNCLAGLYLNDDATITPSSAIALAEISGGLHSRGVKFLAPGSSNTYVMTKNFSSRKVFGKNGLQNSNLRGNSGANPNETSMFTVWLFNNDGGAAVAYWGMYVEIEYTAVFSELKDIESS